MTNAQGSGDQEMCRCDATNITKQGAFKTQNTWIHMTKDCGKQLPDSVKERLQLA